ncbi:MULTISPECIES: M24 family metallopeptidase [unclassified Haloferax]|uniref:M24 family metallopeptidase n=1 Tax=unclassified Haloferax TaxID=2625095 RepID=UPI0002B05B83|nr:MULTISPECIES: M24 family metallopeptidase [unclassified Haloferax]ELZ58226.1 Xaa-Pro aminopeptidase, M24 family protein [Haloferax sp. ATCC BAA-646]ELZ63011.1 Xaa-Pro aminopeptidase, M24 family protein [Haloferax sp. ATCC BAA-645]ELZ63616.1 Xaa-Pro aminopeptidase, M24 family protein [Haloferax sp. ATCC BAA-644]
MRGRPRGGDAIDAAVSERDAVGFVAVSRGADPTSRYLTGRAFDCDLVFVRVDGETHLRVPSTVEPPSLPVSSIRVDDRPPGTAAAAVLAEHAADATEGTVLAPRTIPHDAALHLEAAGYDLASTPAVEAARAVKDDAERDAIEAAQRAATRGVGRAAAILAAATVEEADDRDGDSGREGDGGDGDDEQSVLHWDGAPLSTERLRRQVNATLAAEGVDAAGATTIRAGTRGDGGEPIELRSGEPIVVSVGPRGPTGYRGALARTFVVDPDGGWERRAHVACDAARTVSLVEADPGDDAGFLGSELRAETAAFGFSMADEVTRDVGGGIGLAARENPPLDGDRELVAGNVLRVRAAVTHPDHGRVELTDVLVVGDDGPRLLGAAPTGLDPSRW